MRHSLLGCLGLLLLSESALAAPPVPSGPHPRLFMSSSELSGYAANAKKSGTVAASFVQECQRTLDSPGDYLDRGGADGSTWPGAAVGCAFSYLATQNAAHLAQAIKFWRASLNDDQTLGDNLGCVQGVSTAWQSWAMTGNDPRPPILITVTHDTGYPIRWYGPYVALTYDWLNGAPGVDAALLAQTRTCLGAWLDWYSAYGYHHDEAGANYNAGFVISKALGAIALGNDGGGDGHHWNEVVDDVFGKLLIGQGLKGASGAVGTPAGPMLGGDWAEGWQYGPLSVLEYAVSARALEQNGAALPEMDAWTNSLIVRNIYGTVPSRDGQWVGGDFDSDQVYQSPSENQIDAVLAGPSSDEAASYAAFLKQQDQIDGGGFIYNAFAELRAAPPVDFTAQSPAPPLWYLARGTRTVYARSSWDPSAHFAVFESAPEVVSDHHHFSASNFVLSRGADHLIVDPSFYGCRSTLPTNALTVDSPGVLGDYKPSQTPWSEAELSWARASDSGVVAARSDFAKAFNYADNPSDIPYAHREWVFLPEGEIVAVDRVRTGAAAQNMYVNFHANTGGTLALAGTVASGAVGGSALAIHAVAVSGGVPSIVQPPLDDGNCYTGGCTGVRFAVDEYSLKVPGPYAVAIHAIDGLAQGEAPAEVGSLNDDNFDPAPKQNTGVIGAAVYRSMKQSYVVASSAQDGVSGATLSYGVPGGSAARHIVFDAPEAADGSSSVSAAPAGDRCVLTISAGSGSGFSGHPLMFQVDSAANGCALTESTDVGPAMPPPGGGVTPGSGGFGGATGAGATPAKAGSGCGCRLAPGARATPGMLAFVGFGWLAFRRRRSRSARRV